MLTIISTIKERPPVVASFFKKATMAVLEKKYSLELVFIGDRRSRSLNLKYRKLNKNTDILSFGLEKNLGVMFINLRQAKKKAQSFQRTYPNYLQFLFVHGLCHLKGMSHGSRMENEEKKFRSLLHI